MSTKIPAGAVPLWSFECCGVKCRATQPVVTCLSCDTVHIRPAEEVGLDEPTPIAAVDPNERPLASVEVAPEPVTRERCWFCNGSFRSEKDTFVEFCDQEIGPPFLGQTFVRFNEHGGQVLSGALRYPCTMSTPPWRNFATVMMFTHATCGPDVGYWLSLDRFDGPEPAGHVLDEECSCLRCHVQGKRFGGVMDWARLDALILELRAAGRPARRSHGPRK